jgi:hypothetical protein
VRDHFSSLDPTSNFKVDVSPPLVVVGMTRVPPKTFDAQNTIKQISHASG